MSGKLQENTKKIPELKAVSIKIAMAKKCHSIGLFMVIIPLKILRHINSC
jgi:hypothetical protein